MLNKGNKGYKVSYFETVFVLLSTINSNALKCYSRARDYCMSAKQVVNMCVNVIKVSWHFLLRLHANGRNDVAPICMGLKVWPVSNFAQQHLTTCNRVCKQMQHETSNNVGSCWSTMWHPFVHSLTCYTERLSILIFHRSLSGQFEW